MAMMKIAVAQLKCLVGSIETNLSMVRLFSERARKQGCEMVIFPELTDTGYDMLAVREKASSWDDVPFKSIQQIAAEMGIYLACGLSEREGTTIYNSMAVFDPEGQLIGRYRKIHLLSLDPVCEDEVLTAGEELGMVQVGDLKWGLMICYDLRFPEIARLLVKKGCQGLLICAAWPFPRDHHWKILTQARAIENQVYVVAANRVGLDGPLAFCGSSCIIDPFGRPVVLGSQNNEELLIGDVFPESVIELRQHMPILRDRRDDLYARWVSEP